jgi:DNA-binding CsgD family transcriptional regulator
LAAAAALAVEVDTLVEAIGLYIAPTGPLMLAALTGDEPHSSRFIEAAVDRAKARGEGVAAQHGLFAAAVLYNGLARYDQALASSRHATEAKLVVPSLSWTLPELVEAAVRTGNDALAAKAFERLAECTEGSASDWARGIFARCRALVSPADTAEEHYREAIEYLSRTALRPEHIRAILLYGEWLRRQNRRTDARHQLQAAYDMFSEMGMLAFAERALRELQATGVTVRKRQDDTRNDLTPQEDRIARLALDGKSNPEIGAQLFISARTVEWHLRRVYMKLGVTSRRNLRDALPTRAGTDRRN